MRLFHHTFFNLDDSEPSPTEVRQATQLIDHHGMELARYVVAFAFRQAQETRFKIATFGGIMPYAARAKATYRRDQAAQSAPERRAEREALIANCPLECWKTNGLIFWRKVGDEASVVGQMDCHHDEASHRAEEQRHGIQIAMTPEALTSSRES